MGARERGALASGENASVGAPDSAGARTGPSPASEPFSVLSPMLDAMSGVSGSNEGEGPGQPQLQQTKCSRKDRGRRGSGRASADGQGNTVGQSRRASVEAC